MIDRIFKYLLIRDEEKSTVFYFVLFFVLLGSGMAIGRGTTDALFFKRYGIQYLPVMYIFLSVLLFITSTAYAAFADRLSPEKFFKILNGVLIGLLIISWLIISFFDFNEIYPVYFLVYEIASEILIIHASLYLAKNLDSIQAKRLTPVILAGSQVGSILGGLFLVAAAPVFGVQNLILAWCLLLGLSICLLIFRHRKSGVSLYFRHPPRNKRRFKQSLLDVVVGLKFMKKSNLVRHSSYALFFMVILFYILCYSANRIYTGTFKTEETLTAFFGLLAIVTNSAALLLQLLVSNRVIHRFGIKTINLLFPLTSLISFFSLMLSFTLPAAIITSINKDAIMPAFRNPVRNLFYNILPGYIQGRARAMSVVIVIPLALLVCGGVLWAVQRMQNPLYFLAVGLVCVLFYFYFNVQMNRAYVKEIITHLKNKLYIPGEQEKLALRTGGSDVLEELKKGVLHDDDQISLAYSRVFASAFQDTASDILITRLENASNPLRDQILKLLVNLNPDGLATYLWKEYKSADIHLRTTVLKSLFKLNDTKAIKLITDLVNDDNPRLVSAGILGGLINKTNHEDVYRQWNNLLASDDHGHILSGLDVFKEIDDLDLTKILPHINTENIEGLIRHKNTRICKSCLSAISLWPENSLTHLNKALTDVAKYTDPQIRSLVSNCCHVLDKKTVHNILLTSLEDAHPDVRDTAIENFRNSTPDSQIQFIKWLKDENHGSPRTQQSFLADLLKSGVPNKIMEQISIAKAEDAQTIAHVLMILHKHPESLDNRSTELLVYALQERLEQVIDLALLAMNASEDPSTINLIRTGLKSKDKQVTTQALEALRNLDNQHLAIILTDLMEETTHGEYAENERTYAFNDTHSALAWCTMRHDPWLKACAEDALKAYT